VIDMSDLPLPDTLAKRILELAQSEKISVEELLTIMVNRYTVASRLKVAQNSLTVSGEGETPTTEDVPPPLPTFGAYPPGSLRLITTDNVDQMILLGALKFPRRITGLGYSPNAEYLAIRFENKVILWDMHTSQEYAVFEHDAHAWIETFAFTPDGKSLIVSAGNMFGKKATGSTLHRWNIASRQEEYTWKPEVGFANEIAVNPQNPDVIALMSCKREFVEERPNAITTSNTGIELWNGTNLITRFTDFRQFYQEGYNKLNDRVLAFGYDGKTVFVCLDNGGFRSGQVLAWEGLGNGTLKAISEPNECFMELKLDRQGNNLAFSNAPEGKLTVRNLASGEVIYTNQDELQLPYSLEFDGSGKILVVGRSPRTREAGRVDLVNLQTGETIRRFPSSHFGHNTFSPDNTILAIQTNAIELWGVPH
jgi:WD40 repeat protein